MSRSVPTFHLYGEERRSVDERFTHVEALVDRTRPSEWTIRPHAHADLHHIFHVAEGGGSMQADAASLSFAAPCMLLVPAGTVHGFDWNPESSGSVVSIATAYLRDLKGRDLDLADIFVHPEVIACEDDADIEAYVAALAKEVGRSAPGFRSAADANLLALLVLTLRLKEPTLEMRRRPGSRASLVSRLRERIDQRFRLREPMESYAAALSVSTRELRAACAAIARLSPSQLLDQRSLIEARRLLLYENLSVAEIAYALGFADPAYFSRFFSKSEGIAPKSFRQGSSSGSS